MKIIDAFIFYNELDMLEYRLNILDPFIDYFILVEATLTHRGKPKPLYYQEHKDRFAKFHHKIIHIIDDELKTEEEILEDKNFIQGMEKRSNKVWYNERHQRDSIDRGIKQLNLNNTDLIIIADLDEIPDPRTLSSLKYDGEYNVAYAALEMDMYYFNLNCKNLEKWYAARIVSYDCYVYNFSRNLENIRISNIPTAIIINGGWHLSYFGDPKFIQNKLQNFAHQEFNLDKYTNLKHIEEKINSGNDLFDRKHEKWINIPIANNNNLPFHYETYLQKYIIDCSLAD